MRKFIAALALDVLLAALGGTSSPSRAANGDLGRSFGGYGTNGRVIGDPFPGTQIADAVTLEAQYTGVAGESDVGLTSRTSPVWVSRSRGRCDGVARCRVDNLDVQSRADGDHTRALLIAST
jgi:hypothetical protein